MKLKNKTFNLITIEITRKELIESGFDKIWDEIREQYSVQDYDMEKFVESQDGALFFVELKYKKSLKIIGI